MASKISATILLLLSLIAYSTFTEANCPPPEAEPTPPTKPKPTPPPVAKPTPPTKPKPTPPPVAKPTPPTKPNPTPPPVAKPTPPTKPKPTPPPVAKPTPPTKPAPCPPTPAVPPVQEKCPKDALKLGVCADLLGLVNVTIGNPPSGTPCCTFIKGLADLEAAVCLCTAIKGNVLGLNLNVPVTLSLILSACQKTVPPGFQCA